MDYKVSKVPGLHPLLSNVKIGFDEINFGKFACIISYFFTRENAIELKYNIQ